MVAVPRSRKSSHSSKKSKKSKKSRSSSRSSSKSRPIAAQEFVDEPEQITTKSTNPDDPVVPIADTNPVTTDTNELKTSYAATAAAALDKEKKNPDDAPIAFPKSPDEESAPVAFPSDDASSVRTGTPAGGITFSPETQTPRPGTPSADVDGASPEEKDKKRKRISSQNFQRLARRISLVPKRTASGSSQTSKDAGKESGPGTTTPKKEGSGSGFFSRLSREDSRASGDVGSRASVDTPADGDSVKGKGKGKDKDKDKNKDKDKKKRRLSLKV